MDISPQAALEIAGLLTALGGSYAVASWRIDHHERDFETHKGDVWREVGKLREWRHAHEKETADKRLEIANELADIRVSAAKTDEKFLAIMETLGDIKRQISTLRDDNGR